MRHENKLKSVTYNEEKNQSIKRDPWIKQIIELDKNIKATIRNIIHMFKKVGEITKIRKEMEDISFKRLKSKSRVLMK